MFGRKKKPAVVKTDVSGHERVFLDCDEGQNFAAMTREAFLDHVEQAALLDGVSFFVVCAHRVGDSYEKSTLSLIADNSDAESCIIEGILEFIEDVAKD